MAMGAPVILDPGAPNGTPGQAAWQVQYRAYWWNLDPDICEAIERDRLNGAQEFIYVWNWGWPRPCNYKPPGEAEPSTLARYRLDLAQSVQDNVNTDTVRRVRRVIVPAPSA